MAVVVAVGVKHLQDQDKDYTPERQFFTFSKLVRQLTESRIFSAMNGFERVCVVGLGYVGLPTAAVFASAGVTVQGVDVNPLAVDTVNAGRAHIVEADLDDLLQQVVADGSLRAGLTPEPADAFILAVPTPFKGDHEPDLAYVEAATRAIAPFVKEGDLLVLESTVPPGATEDMVAWLEEERPDLKEDGGVGKTYFAAHCPERVLPGRVLIELVENDRIIGGVTDACSAKAQALYKMFVEGECVVTNARTAELAKLTENSFRDVNIAFANELSLISDKLGVDVWELINLANRHPRVNILHPGPGVGGHCIAVDPWFIVDAAPKEAKIIRTAREVNDGKPEWVIEKAKRAARATGKDRPVIACLGLAFKADIDDLRESPALTIVEQLGHSRIGEILAVEPNIEVQVPSLAKLGIGLADIETAISNADVVILLVDHTPFKDIRLDQVSQKAVIDTRGIW